MDINQAVAVGGFIIALLAMIYKIAGMGHSVEGLKVNQKQLEIDQEAAEARLSHHIADGDKHVNQLYMQTVRKDIDKLELTLNGRVDRLEMTMSGSFEKINNKLDNIARKADARD